jgi:tetratricopeptide (TPR) repeat protein
MAASTGRWGIPVVACLVVSTLVACVVFAAPRGRSARIAGLAALVGAAGWILVDRPLARGIVEVAQRIDARQKSVTGYFLCLVLVVALVAAGLARPGPARRASTWRTTLAATLGAIAIASVYAMTLRPARAEVSAGLAQGYRAQARLPQALQAASRAVNDSPHEEAFRVLLAKVRTGMAGTAADPNARLFFEAESDFHEALRLNPYDGENMANLAVLYGKWSRRSSEGLRAELAQKAHAAWKSALASNPMEPELWSRWGAALSGDIVARQAQSLEGEARRASFTQAEASYARAVELDGTKPAFKSAREGARAAQTLSTSNAPFPFALAR